MPRKNFEFDEQDDVADHSEEEGGIEVDLSTVDKDDKDESPFDDLTPRKLLTRTKKPVAEEEDLEEEESDEGEEEDEEDDRSSRAKPNSSWRKRLLRQERLLEEVREENKELAERNKAIEARFTKGETEAALITKRADAESKLVRIRTELAAAKEAGNTADEIRLQEEMSDVKADLRVAESRAADVKSANATAEPVTRQPRLARQWLRRHQRYHSDTAFQAFVKAIDKQVASEGFDMNDDEYWAVLDERVAKRYPEEYKGASKKRELPTARRHPARGVDPDESQSGKRKDESGFRRTGKGVVLSPGQLRNMARFGMDPESESDRKAYVTNNLSK